MRNTGQILNEFDSFFGFLGQQVSKLRTEAKSYSPVFSKCNIFFLSKDSSLKPGKGKCLGNRISLHESSYIT